MLNVPGGWGLSKWSPTRSFCKVLFGGTLPATCSQLPQPQNTPALGTKPVRVQGCHSIPAQYVLRRTESECVFCSFCFHPIIWTGVYSELQSCGWFVFSVSFYYNLFHFHIDVYMLCWDVFFMGYCRAWSKFPCVTRWVLFTHSFLVLHSGSWSLIFSIVVCI